MIVHDLHLDHIHMEDVEAEFSRILSAMNRPVGFTINFHRFAKHRTKNGWVKESLSLPAIEKFWDYFSGELRHISYFSFQRKRVRDRVLAFANIDIGLVEGLYHLHGVIDNARNVHDAPFSWIIRQAIRNAHSETHIVSGDPHIETKLIDKGWVGYCFKRNDLCYPLYAK